VTEPPPCRLDSVPDPRDGSVAQQPRWHDIAYLAGGSARQRRAHRAIEELGVLRDLAGFDATLVGTIPLEIAEPTSDLDIVCRASDPARFAAELRRLYGTMPGFHLDSPDAAITVAGFAHGGERFEVFGQDRPVSEQAGFRHMVVEWRLLALGGDRLRRAVRRLRRAGAKTEPAFAAALGLVGDPFQRLFELWGASDADLLALLRAASAT
jgi:Domain of unknown function (DUF4269)